MLRLIRFVERHPVAVVGVMVVVALIVVLAPRLASRTHAPDQNHPEIIAAAVALTYVELADRGTPSEACTALTRDLAEEYACDTASPRLHDCGAGDPAGVRVAAYEPPGARIHAGECELTLRETQYGDWRVSAIGDRP